MFKLNPICFDTKQEVRMRMLEYVLQHCSKDCNKKSLPKIKFATHPAHITEPKLLNSVLCGLYLKIPRKLTQNLLFS